MRAWTFPAFRLLWCSSLASAGAQAMERVATGWLALESGGSPLGVGVVLAARMLPSFLFGLAAGTVADRVDRRRVLLAVAFVAAALALGLAHRVSSGGVTLWQIAVIAFLSGWIQVSDAPARQALVVDTVGRANAPNAIALNAVASRLFSAIGAFGGGLIIPALGVANCYVVVALFQIVGFAFVAALRTTPAFPFPRDRPSFGRALADAGRLILDYAAVRTLVLAAVACEVFAFSYQTVMPTVARDVLQAGAEGLGTMNAAAAVGATCAALGLSSLPRGVRHEPLLSGVYLLYGGGIIAFALAPSLAVATVAIFVVGGCAAAFDALQQTLIQLAVPEGQRGRAVGIWVFSIGSGPLGHLEIGALAQAIGAPGALLTNGSLVLASALALILRAPDYRWRRTRAPDLSPGP